MMRQATRLFLPTVLLAGCALVDNPLDHDANGEPAVLAIESGVSVKGAGPAQQWEGIVQTMWKVSATEGEVCTATFITDRHLITAAHCYPKDGVQKINVRAPTWSGKDWKPFDANVQRASSNLSVDVAVVDLGAPQEWATPARRFKLFAGTVSAPTEVHLYGYGGRTDASPDIDGTLRAAPNNATVKMRDAGRGFLSASAGVARACGGDSGGPALREGTEPLIYGVFSAFSNSISRILRDNDIVCPDPGSDLRYGSVSAAMAFIERSLGKPCTRVTVDGQPAAQCW